MFFKLEGTVSTLSGKPLKFVDQFTKHGGNISSTESDVNVRITKAWTAIDSLTIIWESHQSDKIKLDFFQAVTLSVLLNRCTTSTQKKRMKNQLQRITQECYVLFGTNPGSRREVVRVLGCDVEVSEFEFQSRYYVHFRTNTLGKGMNALILPAMG